MCTHHGKSQSGQLVSKWMSPECESGTSLRVNPLNKLPTDKDDPSGKYSGNSNKNIYEYNDDDLLGCDAVQTRMYKPTFRRNIALSMETVCFSETVISTYESTWRQNPEQQHRHPHRRENLISHKNICKSYKGNW
jgi:hypothetical protein